MLKKRIISALVGIPLIVAILYTGGVYWIAFFTLLALGGLYEFNQMTSVEYRPSWFLSFFLLLILMFYNYNNLIIPILVLFMFVTVIYLIIKYPQINIVDIALSIFPPLYLGFAFSFALLLNHTSYAFKIMLLIFLLTWSSDVGGYLFGRLWGKHKLAPQLSPNKTWEGALGGIILTIITTVIFFIVFSNGAQNWFMLVLLGFLASLAAQLGDLFMSSVKRKFAIKDSGHLIPGHGGILDRFDSFILVLPVVYCCIFYGQIL